MFKGFIDKLKKSAEEKLHPDTSPEAVRKRKKEDNEKNFKRAAGAAKLTKKGMDAYKQVSDKVDGVAKGAAEKTIEIADKAAPIAEKVDGAIDLTTGAVKDALGGAFNIAKGVFSKGKKAAGEKLDDVKKDSAGKPSTGSGLLDILTPAVPETDATKAKKEAPKPPKP